MPLANNRELFDYMLSLGTTLKDRGANELGQLVLDANRLFAGMSTEFLGESRAALREVLAAGTKMIDDAERAKVVDVVRQLDKAFGVV
jgi:hypothetical protein